MNAVKEIKTVNTDEIIEVTLRKLGLTKSYKGFNYLLHAITLVLEDPDILTYICKGLYIEIAIRHGTTITCVERNIRTAKEVIWSSSNTGLLKSIFGDKYDSKVPNNAIFIDMLAYYIKSLQNQ